MKTVREEKLDLVKLLINNTYFLKAKKIGNSIYLHVPAEIVKTLNIKDNDIVKVLILSIEEVIK